MKIAEERKTDLPIRCCKRKARKKPAILGRAIGCKTYIPTASLKFLPCRIQPGDSVLICSDDCVFAKFEEAARYLGVKEGLSHAAISQYPPIA